MGSVFGAILQAAIGSESARVSESSCKVEVNVAVNLRQVSTNTQNHIQLALDRSYDESDVISLSSLVQ
jgi:hypothetical protein